jgi:hypothetical protein
METEGQRMLDNMTISANGRAILQEDPGNQAHIAKVHQYDFATDTLKTIAQHDPNRFVIGGPNFLTQDEESSGILDMSEILGPGMYLLNVQAHYPIPGELVEGGTIAGDAHHGTSRHAAAHAAGFHARASHASRHAARRYTACCHATCRYAAGQANQAGKRR